MMSKSKSSSESTPRVRRTFTNEFKHDAASLVLDQGDTLAAAPRSRGLHPNSFVSAIESRAHFKVNTREAECGTVSNSEIIRKWKQKFMPENNEQTVLSGYENPTQTTSRREPHNELRILAVLSIPVNCEVGSH